MATVPQKLANRFGGKPEEYVKRSGLDEENRPRQGWWFQRQLCWRRDTTVDYYIGPSLHEIQSSPNWALRGLGEQVALECWLLPRIPIRSREEGDSETVTGYYVGKETLWQIFDRDFGMCLAYEGGVLHPTQVLSGTSVIDLIEQIKRAETLPFPEACCDKAETIPCVCHVSFKCPEHHPNGYHIGTHD